MLRFNCSFSMLVLAPLLVACAGQAVAPTATPLPPTPTSIPPTPTPATTKEATVGRIEVGQLTSPALAGNLLGDPATRAYLVYLPPSYDSTERRYPVVYFLHAFSAHWNAESAWDSGYFAQTIMEPLIQDVTIGEMIIVFASSTNKYGGSWYRSSPVIGDYETYIVRDLVNQIDATYRTLANPASRAIAGHSMGGYGAIRLALNHPDVFGVAVGADGSYTFDGPKGRILEAYKGNDNNWGTAAQFQGMGRSLAAVAAPRPDLPPLYLDEPAAQVNGEWQLVPEVWDKIEALAIANDLPGYQQQSAKLRKVLILHGKYDDLIPVQVSRDLATLFIEAGIEHELVELDGGHEAWDGEVVLEFLSENLVFEPE